MKGWEKFMRDSRGWKFGRRCFPGIGNCGFAIAVAAGFFVSGFAARAQLNTNLMQNGSFDNALEGWHYSYDLGGESWYKDNEKCVSVVAQESGHRNVLQLMTPFGVSQNQGVKVDSKPLPIDLKGHYRLSVTARSDGPDCRILLEGYKWRPGIKPHENPELSELRKEYKFVQVYFNGGKSGAAKEMKSKSSGSLTGGKVNTAADKGGSGDFGGVTKAWKTSEMTFPDEKMTELAKSMFDQVKFVVLHVVAIGGPVSGSGYGGEKSAGLFVDDIKLERIR